MLGFNDAECSLKFETLIKETDTLNEIINNFSKLNNTGDTANQITYSTVLIKGKVSSLREEATFALGLCNSKKVESKYYFSDFLNGWYSTFNTLLHVYKNDIFNKKKYTVTNNLIEHSQKELNGAFYHFKDCHDSYCPEMVVIPSGTFMMDGIESFQKHRVNIEKSFAIGLFEVTLKQFREFVKEASHVVPNGGITLQKNLNLFFSNDINYNSPNGNDMVPHENEPVTCLRKEDTRLFLRWLSNKTNQTYRLPTESEWEYAARSNLFQFSNYIEKACKFDNVFDKSSSKIYGNNVNSFNCSDGSSTISSVGSYFPNGFGLYDMMGNVKEWVDDCYHENFYNAPNNGSSWGSENNGLCSYGVFKGGCWASKPNDIKVSMRHTIFSSQAKSNTIGFRLVREI
ncbi:hypothetical protein DICPUDRAFT_147640 [Dictyostelium purpureum]|uniref:Sulfatase-modifying factor enzyme-like domain-containing protein n=1 Tax=Dictyostelium purpureum TaxID=5786 RepID=F0Z908_DICPU|nr:uncharacterized protein DICPUDRAFT_147640 [Dictyostelium purpureum]EGC39576.1 hypothetical protein DICPUDRAFT_147640 [Dictyostelium purpureum]|eukprot:XP_003283911.1 hypothetical protein DICPUDRAFT_147640 [Dictyostelium purpureum]